MNLKENVGQYAKQQLKNKAKKKAKKVIGSFVKKFILPYLLPILVVALIVVLVIIILLALLGWFTGKEQELKEEQNGQAITLTIGANGLFKTSSQKVSWNKYEIYAVLDEAAFQEYIQSGNYDGFYSKTSSTVSDSDNVSDSDTDESENDYAFLKEMLVKLTASKYPDDVNFVLNKTLKFEDGEDPTDQKIIDEKIKKIKNNLSTKTITGGVSVYRNSTDNKLEYAPTRDDLDDAYYTLEDVTGKDGKLKNEMVIFYAEKNISTNSSSSEGTDVRKFKEFDFQELISPYIMPIDFINELYMLTRF